MDRKIIDYFVISDDVIDDFQDMVKNAIQLGYVPYGSPILRSDDKHVGYDAVKQKDEYIKTPYFAQAMVKYEPLPSKTNG